MITLKPFQAAIVVTVLSAFGYFAVAPAARAQTKPVPGEAAWLASGVFRRV